MRPCTYINQAFSGFSSEFPDRHQDSILSYFKPSFDGTDFQGHLSPQHFLALCNFLRKHNMLLLLHIYSITSAPDAGFPLNNIKHGFIAQFFP